MSQELTEIKKHLKICLDYIDDCESYMEEKGILDDFTPLIRPFGSKEYSSAKKALESPTDGAQ